MLDPSHTHSDGDFDEQVLWRLLDSRQWAKALSEVETRIARAETPERRSFYFMFLATLYKCLIRQSRRAGDRDSADGYAAEAVRAYELAIHASERDVSPRIGLAEFYLRHRKRPEQVLQALQLLAEFEAEDYAFHNDLDYQDHKRMVLRGLALAMTGATDAGVEALLIAYGDSFQAKLIAAYKTPLWTMMRRGPRLPTDAIEEIVLRLGKFKASRPNNTARIRQGLLDGAMPPAPLA